MQFHPFGSEHFATLAIGAIVTAILLIMGKLGGNWRTFSWVLLAFTNLSAYPLSQAAWRSLGIALPLDNTLPFHLCDLTAITAGFALLTKRPLLCSLTYFWGLAATMQALLTPALGYGFPSLPFFAFFIQHFAIVATALYLPIVEGWRPKHPLWKGPLEAYALSVVYMFAALAVNYCLGTNFGFVSHLPENPSILDYLGPWPLYLVPIQAVALGLFLFLSLPFLKTAAFKKHGNTKQEGIV